MTALLEQLDRLAELRTAARVSAPEEEQAAEATTHPALARLQTASQALYGKAVPAAWLPQVLATEVTSAEAMQAKRLPLYTERQSTATIAHRLAREADPSVCFPTVVFTEAPATLADWVAQVAEVEAPTPTGYRRHCRPASATVRTQILERLTQWKARDLRDRQRRESALKGGLIGIFLGALSSWFGAPSWVSLSLMTAGITGFSLAWFWHASCWPEGFAARLANELAEHWSPETLTERDFEILATFPALARDVQTWAHSDTGLLKEDLVELRWRHRLLLATQTHQRSMERLDALAQQDTSVPGRKQDLTSFGADFPGDP